MKNPKNGKEKNSVVLYFDSRSTLAFVFVGGKYGKSEGVGKTVI